jgi:hypothetical protein
MRNSDNTIEPSPAPSSSPMATPGGDSNLSLNSAQRPSTTYIIIGVVVGTFLVVACIAVWFIYGRAWSSTSAWNARVRTNAGVRTNARGPGLRQLDPDVVGWPEELFVGGSTKIADFLGKRRSIQV